MSERLKQYYCEEEKFLDEYYDVATVASEIVNGDWQLDSDCNDQKRKNTAYSLSSGLLMELCFDAAAVYHEHGRFSSAQITLKSSKRSITIRVKLIDGKLVVEKNADNAIS